MRSTRIVYRPLVRYSLGSLAIALVTSWGWSPAVAQLYGVTLAAGFQPNPMVLKGTGGGDRPAADVVGTERTGTGPCLGYISTHPHEEMLFESHFTNLEMRVESDLDTTLIISGPDGVWCNDDHGGPNPAIVGQWAPGNYRIWIGAYRAKEVPEYELLISDNS
jgi:hypothetical protein